MNAKELKIEAPEGYEVDWENSSMNTIRFKPIKKKITYEDICKNLFRDKLYWRLTDTGVPKISTSSDGIISTSKQQLEQLLALNKLMNVAKYLNGDWEPDFTDNQHKFYISYNSDVKKLTVWFKQYMNDGCVYFKTEELALQAIEILGEEKIKKALGIFE